MSTKTSPIHNSYTSALKPGGQTVESKYPVDKNTDTEQDGVYSDPATMSHNRRMEHFDWLYRTYSWMDRSDVGLSEADVAMHNARIRFINNLANYYIEQCHSLDTAIELYKNGVVQPEEMSDFRVQIEGAIIQVVQLGNGFSGMLPTLDIIDGVISRQSDTVRTQLEPTVGIRSLSNLLRPVSEILPTGGERVLVDLLEEAAPGRTKGRDGLYYMAQLDVPYYWGEPSQVISELLDGADKTPASCGQPIIPELMLLEYLRRDPNTIPKNLEDLIKKCVCIPDELAVGTKVNYGQVAEMLQSNGYEIGRGRFGVSNRLYYFISYELSGGNSIWCESRRMDDVYNRSRKSKLAN